MAPTKPHIVILGGSYAGLSALNGLIDPIKDQGISTASLLAQRPRFTVLDERDGFYHSVGAPLGQISSPHAREFWVQFEELAQTKYAQDSVEFVQGTAKSLDLHSRALDYAPTGADKTNQLQYDYLIVATGTSRKWPVVPSSLSFERYMQDVTGFEKKLQACSRIAVVGGGACGVEMAGEIKAHWPEKHVALIHSGSTVLNREPLSDEYKATALQLLRDQGVEVTLNVRVQDDKSTDTGHTLTLSGDKAVQYDAVIYSAVQQGVNTGFVPSEALDDQGCIKVRKTLQFPSGLPNADYHYGVGDVAAWDCIKRSVPAMSMGAHAASNILASLVAQEKGERPRPTEIEIAPGSMTLSIGDYAMSNRSGISSGKELKLRAFGTGLGIDGTLSYLGLRPRKSQTVTAGI